MQRWNRSRRRGIARTTFVVLMLGAGVACFPQSQRGLRVQVTAEMLDAIDAAVGELAHGRWPSWSMEIDGDRLTFKVEVAEESAAEVCAVIGEAVRRSGEDIAWSAEITRGGLPLSRCALFALVAGAPPSASGA